MAAAFITGAGSGIGRATALAYAKARIPVALVDFSEPQVSETLDLIREGTDTPAEIFLCDVSIDGDVNRAFFNALECFGQIKYAFNNAGIEGDPCMFHDSTDESWDGVLNVNLKSVWLCMKYELYHMAKQREGAIVNCSSIAGLVGLSRMAPYVASKHGILGLTKVAALEYAALGVRVNAVCPGVTETPMTYRFLKQSHISLSDFTRNIPMGRLGLPEEVAEAVFWLNSEKASYVTGEALTIDGGWTAQ